MKSGAWSAFQAAAELNYDNHPDANWDLMEESIMTNLDDLVPCPNCNGETDVFLVNHPDRPYQVECRACKMTGPQVATEQEAINTWNNIRLTAGMVSVRNSRGGYANQASTVLMTWNQLIGEEEGPKILENDFPKGNWGLIVVADDVAYAIQNFIAVMGEEESLIKTLNLLSQENIVEARITVKSTEELKLLPISAPF